MKKTRRIHAAATALVIFLILASSCSNRRESPAATGSQDMNPELSALITSFYEPPEQEKIEGMSRSAFMAHAERARTYMEKLKNTIDYDTLAVADQVDYDYFQAQLDNSLLMIEDLRRWEKDPSMYIPFNGFFRPSLDENRPWNERFGEMVDAMEKDMIMFTWGKENLKNPPLLWTERAIESCDYIFIYLDQSLPDIIERAPDESLKNRMKSAAEKYRAALTDYRRFLDTDLRARSNGTFVVGEENYRRLLRNHFMDYTVDKLIEIGERELDKNLKLLEETARKIDPEKTWVQLLRENTLDHVAPWNLFADLKREALRARKIVYEQMVNVPDDIEEEYRYAQAPHYETIAQGQSGIGPWVFVGEKYVGYFAIPYIDNYKTMDRKSLFMRDWNRSWYIAQHIPHEVYPGHHFQAFMESKTTRPARKYAGSLPFTYVNSSFVEGWGVYGEEVMSDLGYFQGDLRMYLAHLGHRMWRIARILIDPKMHTRGMSYDEAHAFFMNIGLTSGQAHVETTQATMNPVHDASYYIGKLEIMQLLKDYKAQKGSRFDFKKFHTELLLLGGVPPKLARREMLR